jgi:hypothetical protein
LKRGSKESASASSLDTESREFIETRDFINVLETNQLIQVLEETLQKYQSDDMQFYIAGSPIVTKNLQASLISDMSTFILYVIMTIAFLLMVMFKRLSGIVLPLLIVVLTLISTVGSMAFAGVPITAMTQILPSLLLASVIN